MTDEEARDFVASHEWVYAKTYPTMPHEYIVFPFEGCDADKARWHDFRAWVVKSIDQRTTKGYPARTLGDHYYWVIWPVINRACGQGARLVLESEDVHA